VSLDDDDRLIAFYNAELIALSGEAAIPQHIDKPDLKARAVSPICGSEVEVELKVAGNKITAFGFEVEACALTRAVLAVMKRAIIGKTREDVARAGAELETMLGGHLVLPSGDWARLQILEPVKDYKARHNSILLPFEAVERAFENKGLAK
jgi:NifU-like protein involved in Fe-S cluster formation